MRETFFGGLFEWQLYEPFFPLITDVTGQDGALLAKATSFPARTRVGLDLHGI